MVGGGLHDDLGLEEILHAVPLAPRAELLLGEVEILLSCLLTYTRTILQTQRQTLLIQLDTFLHRSNPLKVVRQQL